MWDCRPSAWHRDPFHRRRDRRFPEPLCGSGLELAHGRAFPRRSQAEALVLVAAVCTSPGVATLVTKCYLRAILVPGHGFRHLGLKLSVAAALTLPSGPRLPQSLPPTRKAWSPHYTHFPDGTADCHSGRSVCLPFLAFFGAKCGIDVVYNRICCLELVSKLSLFSDWFISTLPLKLPSSKQPSLIARVGQGCLLWAPTLGAPIVGGYKLLFTYPLMQ